MQAAISSQQTVYLEGKLFMLGLFIATQVSLLLDRARKTLIQRERKNTYHEFLLIAPTYFNSQLDYKNAVLIPSFPTFTFLIVLPINEKPGSHYPLCLLIA